MTNTKTIYLNVNEIKEPVLTFRKEDVPSLKELQDDIEKRGLLNPPMVAKLEDGSYQLIVFEGERRLMALRNLVNLNKINPIQPFIVMNIKE